MLDITHSPSRSSFHPSPSCPALEGWLEWIDYNGLPCPVASGWVLPMEAPAEERRAKEERCPGINPPSSFPVGSATAGCVCCVAPKSSSSSLIPHPIRHMGGQHGSVTSPRILLVPMVSLHPAHTFANGLIITFLNYPNLSVPSVCCGDSIYIVSKG